MEVSTGYMPTEVGAVPRDWDVVPLGERATFRTGPFGSALHKSDYTYDGVPIVNPMHIIDGRIEPTRWMTVTEHAARHLSDYRMSPGEIVIGRRGDMGRCAVVREQHRGWLCGTGSMIIRPANTDSEFLQRVLSTPRARAAIEGASVGTTMSNMNQGTLAGLKVQFPPLEEQRAISQSLNDVDALLSGMDLLVAKKRALRAAAMRQLLSGETRLPGFKGEWATETIGDLTMSIVGGGTPSRSQQRFWGGDVPWVTVKDFASFDPSGTQESITLEGVQMSATNVLPARTLIVATRIALGRAIAYDVPVAINQDLKALLLRPSVDLQFMLLWFAQFGHRIAALGSGSTVMGISLGELARFELEIPALDEQVAIARVLNTMDEEIALLRQRRDKTLALKEAMMQELLSGRVRLPGQNRSEKT